MSDGGLFPWKTAPEHRNHTTQTNYSPLSMSTPYKLPDGYTWIKESNGEYHLVEAGVNNSGNEKEWVSIEQPPEATVAVASTSTSTSATPPSSSSPSSSLPVAIISTPTSPGGTLSTGVTAADMSSSQPYLLHKISRSTETLQGICLRYKVNLRELQKMNCFSGDNLSLAPDFLKIPPKQGQKVDANRGLSDEDVLVIERRNLVEKFYHEFDNNLSRVECKFYLEDNGYDYEKAKLIAISDNEWEAKNKLSILPPPPLDDVGMPNSPNTIEMMSNRHW